MSEPGLQVVLCWHMHQPDYFDPAAASFQEPWTYLHAIKDYTDMAAHLEAHPRMPAVVNFSPVLLEQIDVYARDLAAVERGEGRIHDPLLAMLHQPLIPGERDRRLELLHICLRPGDHRLFSDLPVYRRLRTLAEHVLSHPVEASYLDDQFFIDLLVWYHLGWMGATVRRDDDRVRALFAQERHYSPGQCRQLISVIRDRLEELIPRYRRLAERGQVELSVTPYSHPILPLLIDFERGRDAWPDCPLPVSGGFPGGEERCRWQLAEARVVFERFFGTPPDGCWPSEGGISADTLAIAGDAGFRWLASGQAVLRNSLATSSPGPGRLYRPYRMTKSGPACFFRDDELSDAIGFVYRDWHGDDAVADFVSRLEAIAASAQTERPLLVPVILDGENAWEHYPDNGYYFLDGLYRALSEHPSIAPTTFSRYLEDYPDAAGSLRRMVSGSWVYGTFSTWIGDPEKNRAWDLLVAAKRVFDGCRSELPPERLAAAQRQLARCESSDWFWWLGDDNPEDAVAHFERLFRVQLVGLYRLLGCDPPDELARVFTHGVAAGQGGAMRPAT